MRLTTKIGNKRFRFGGNREPQFMWSLVIGHLRNSWPPSPLIDNKHIASGCAVTGITARAAKRAAEAAQVEELWMITPQLATH
jgi:hypothetical protein